MSLFKRRLQYIPILSNFHIFKKYNNWGKLKTGVYVPWVLLFLTFWCAQCTHLVTAAPLICALDIYCGWETECCCNTERDATKCSLLWRIRRRQVGMNGSVTDGWQSKANRSSRRDFSSIPTLPPTLLSFCIDWRHLPKFWHVVKVKVSLQRVKVTFNLTSLTPPLVQWSMRINAFTT